MSRLKCPYCKKKLVIKFDYLLTLLNEKQAEKEKKQKGGKKK